MNAGLQTYKRKAAESRRDRLVAEHLGFVRHVFGKMSGDLPHNVDRENLEAAGVLGLVEAAHKFDPAHGAAFRSYAYPRIRGAIIDELRRNSPLTQDMTRKIAMIRESVASLPAPATELAIAAATGMTTEEISECFAAMRLTQARSLSESNESIADAAEQNDNLSREEEKHLLAEAILSLPQQQRRAVTLYYQEDLRMKEIGAILGVSESRVSKLLSQAMLQMKEYVRERLE